MVAEDEDNEEPGVLVDVGVGETLHLKVGYFKMTYLMVERAQMKIKIHLCLEVTLPSPLLFLLAVEWSREVMSVTVKLVVYEHVTRCHYCLCLY